MYSVCGVAKKIQNHTIAPTKQVILEIPNAIEKETLAFAVQ